MCNYIPSTDTYYLGPTSASPLLSPSNIYYGLLRNNNSHHQVSVCSSLFFLVLSSCADTHRLTDSPTRRHAPQRIDQIFTHVLSAVYVFLQEAPAPNAPNQPTDQHQCNSPDPPISRLPDSLATLIALAPPATLPRLHTAPRITQCSHVTFFSHSYPKSASPDTLSLTWSQTCTSYNHHLQDEKKRPAAMFQAT